MFRNAEYVLALKEIMNLRGKVSIEDYKEAFDRLDVDQSGYIDSSEIQTLFEQVYGDGKAPNFEIDAFMKYFDSNNDGKISWDEFEHGLGAAYVTQLEKGASAARLLGQSVDDDDKKLGGERHQRRYRRASRTSERRRGSRTARRRGGRGCVLAARCPRRDGRQRLSACPPSPRGGPDR